MTNIEKAFSETLDVLKHLVSTHVRWNVDMSHEEALAKLETARLHSIADDAANAVSDAVTTVQDVQTGNAAGAVDAAEKTAGDVVSIVKDAKSE